MKLKRLLAGFIAVAMTAAMIPAMVFADESENKAEETTAVETTEAKEEEKKPEEKKPEAKAEETEKKEEPEEKPAEPKAEEPAETENKKADEPAESKEAEPAETEDKQPAEKAPEETKQPDTVSGKTSGESDSDTPKKAPIEVKEITGIGFQGNNTLIWDPVFGADEYTVRINTIEVYADLNRLENIITIINDAIKEGRLKKPSDLKFKFTVFARDDDRFILAKGVKEFTFNASQFLADEPSLLSIPKAKIKDGRLSWKNLSKANYYLIYINGTCAEGYNDSGKKGINLKPLVNKLIRQGDIDKAGNNKYSIVLLAYYWDDVVGRYAATLTYKTSAKRNQNYTFENVGQSNGRLRWDAIKGASYYVCDIDDIYGGDDVYYYSTKSTSADINNMLAYDLEAYNSEEKPSSFLYRLQAYNSYGDVIAVYYGTFNYEVAPNPLSIKGKTAKVKYSKLKKKKQTLKASQVISGLGTGRGPLTFIKKSGHKNISINKKTGTVTIKKNGLKKGKTYSVTVSVTAAGNYGYDPSEEKIVTFKIKVV